MQNKTMQLFSYATKLRLVLVSKNDIIREDGTVIEVTKQILYDRHCTKDNVNALSLI